jgi:hypothetical protein
MYAYPSDLKLTDDIERRLAQQEFDDLSLRGSEGVGRLFLQVGGGVLLFVIAMLFIAKVG